MTRIDEDWIVKEDSLERTFDFKSYTKTISFVNAVAWVANKQNHHPDMLVSYNKCIIRLTTHDAGNKVTEQDYSLASAIDQLM